MSRIALPFLISCSVACVVPDTAPHVPPTAAGADWIAVGGDRGAARYSSLDEIHRGNVADLEVAWTWHTGELERGGKTIECTPLVVGSVMYVTTAYLRVAALDAATGEELWSFDPFTDLAPTGMPLASGGVNRGLAYWSDDEPGGERRILHGISDGRLFSLDAYTGALDPAFGEGGVLDLRAHVGRDLSRMPYGPTSAPAICEDVVILGFSCGEGPGPSAPGDVRAFDVRTGEPRWSFRTVPGPGEVGNDSWAGDSWRERGGANAWGGVSVDVERGWAFFGLGSAAFDFYGGDRHGANLFANCVVAVDARTGERQWHFQTLHHDLWDHDLPIHPTLVRVQRDGALVDAVAQVTKQGYVFLLDRDTGEPLFEVEEVPAPASDIPGEQAWPTQPVPVAPPPLCRVAYTDADVPRRTPEIEAAVRERLQSLRHGERFLPPSFEGTVVTPGFHGGATWSGACFDERTGLLYVNVNDVPNVLTIVPPPDDRPGDYRITGYHKFLDPDGYPAIEPPWGSLVAVDLEAGTIAWRTPIGGYPELMAKGLPPTGTESFGGAIVTAGGLVFIGGSADERFHAYDAATGELLWEHDLPAGGYATPSTYSAGGRQYVVIAAGGAGKVGTRAGDAFVAFRLPE